MFETVITVVAVMVGAVVVLSVIRAFYDWCERVTDYIASKIRDFPEEE